MNLHSDYPYWMIKEGLKSSFATLDQDLKVEVLIIGGGISGALIGHTLATAGHEVVLLEKRHIAHGSTSASTALLQYEIDVPLFELMKTRGVQQAVRCYQLCVEAIAKIALLSSKSKGAADFELHPSLLYASYKKHIAEILQPEFSARKANGFDVQWLEENDIQQKFGFNAPAGILSAAGAQVNPYLLTHQLMEEISKLGGRIFDLTEIDTWETTRQQVKLTTKAGQKIQAKYVVVACGYESQKYLNKNVARLHSSYAIISKPLAEKEFWYQNSLLWETKTPYLYLRTTSDQRILLGGRDETFHSPGKRDRLISRKAVELEQDFKKLFPAIPFQRELAWAGTFAETEDGLPFIGSYDHPRLLFAMGYGGNGILFSMIAADILKDQIAGIVNHDAPLFAFDR